MSPMYRWLPLLALCGGCDLALGLDLAGEADGGVLTHDEDGDGIDDAVDGCPHLAGSAPDDGDGDGIPAACDDDDARASTATFYALTTGLPGGAQPLQGLVMQEADALVLGEENVTVIALDRRPTTALVDIGFEVISNQVEDGLRDQPWAEVGVHTTVRSPAAGEFGAACYLGRKNGTPLTSYLEAFEDNAPVGSAAPASVTFTGQAGRLRIVRDPTHVDCQANLADGSVVGFTSGTQALAAVDGAIGVSAGHARIRIRYVWISAAP